MPKVKSEAFDLKDSQMKGPIFDGPDATNKREQLALWLIRELENAIEARGNVSEEIKYGWTLYEQGRTRLGKSAPWPDAADLTSPFAAEYVDSLHARMMQTVLVEPMYTVEGFGESTPRAPIVEEFHQRAAEEERLQTYLDEVFLRAFIEPAGILEVSEAFEMRREVERKRVALELDPATQLPIMGEDEQPMFQRNTETGDYLEPMLPDQPSAEVDVDSWQPVRLGPDYDVVPYLDFLTLPNHARNRSQIWGYAKRFFRRVPELQWRASRGIYDKEAVEAIGTDNERQALSDEAPKVHTVPTQDGPTAQKELWEVQFLGDLDGQGERWWRATVSRERRQLLRLKLDDRTTRYIRFVPFPKPGSVDGYSLVTNKMITVIEEDTAVRNMRADKAALAVSGPILKMSGGLWDPYDQPIGPRSVIEVRDKNEISQLQFSDVPTSIIQWKRDVRDDADRLVGQNDVAMGQQTDEKRTLGEVQLTAGYAEVRMNAIVKRMQEPLEELWQARHAIWKRTLATKPEGVPMRQSMVVGLEARGIDMQTLGSNQRITAQMLDGQFWGKPRGSVETADLNRQRQDFNSFLQTLPALMQLNPAIAMIFQTIPAAKALVEQMLRVNRVPDKQSFLGSEAQGIFQQQQQLQDPMAQMLLQMANGVPAMGMGAGMPQIASGQPQNGGNAQPVPTANGLGVM